MDLNRIKPVMKQFTEIGPPGCAVAVSRDGKAVFEHYEGLAHLGSKKPVEKDTVYRLYSDTKLITVVAAMMLYERGLFLLQDPLADYLPCFKDATVYCYDGSDAGYVDRAHNPVRVKDLMTMTAGIPYGGVNNYTQQQITKIGAGFPAKPMKLQDFAKEMSRVPLAFEPGTHWNYGYGMDILGAVIEVLSGKTLGRFFREEIFGPLGMEHTAFFLNDALRANLAGQYTLTTKGLQLSDLHNHAFEEGHLFESGGGGLLSTLGDMSTFVTMLSMGGTLHGERIIGRRTIDLIRMNHLQPHQLEDFKTVHKRTWPQMAGYGWGLSVRTLMDPAMAGSNSTAGEFGWSGAAGTWTMVDVENGISAVYMHQLVPSTENMQQYCHPRIRNIIYGALD